MGETSILTRAALTVANAFRGDLLAQEGAFGTLLLESDVVARPLMFGQGGTIDADSALDRSRHGFGLDYLPEFFLRQDAPGSIVDHGDPER